MKHTTPNTSLEPAESATISKAVSVNPPSNAPETTSANPDSAPHAKTSNPKSYRWINQATTCKSKIVPMPWTYCHKDIAKNTKQPHRKMQDWKENWIRCLMEAINSEIPRMWLCSITTRGVNSRLLDFVSKKWELPNWRSTSPRTSRRLVHIEKGWSSFKSGWITYRQSTSKL